MSKSHVEVKDHGFAALMKRVKDIAGIKKAAVKVGVLADDKKGGMHAVGRDGKAAKLTLAEIFAVLNYGTRDGKIPPRPVLVETFNAKRDELKTMGARLIGDVVLGNLTLDQALGILGSKLASDVKSAIVAGFPPPNAPGVALMKAMKGRTRALLEAKPSSIKATSEKRVAANLRGLGDAFAAIGATAGAEQGGYGLGLRIRRKGIKAAGNLGQAFAQIGAIASVKPFIDTGRLLGAITYAVVKDHGGGSHGHGGGGGHGH